MLKYLMNASNESQEINDQDWMPVPFYLLQTSNKFHEENQEGIWGNYLTASAQNLWFTLNPNESPELGMIKIVIA